MPDNTVTQKHRVDQLIELTRQGQIGWTYVFDEDPDNLDEAESPIGYAARDRMHGFGLVIIRFEDQMIESLKPTLTVSGELMEEVAEAAIKLLIDAIEVYIDEVQAGRRQTTADRIANAAQQISMPFAVETERLNRIASGLMTSMQGQQKTVDELVTAIHNSQQISYQILAQLQQTTPQPVPIDVVENTDTVALTPKTLLACLNMLPHDMPMQEFLASSQNQLQEDLQTAISSAVELLGRSKAL